MDSILENEFPIQSIGKDQFPGLLAQVPKLPETLRIRGALPPQTHTYITVVGSRKHTDYGAEACRALIRGLAGLPVVIVSGLALGIDSIAHRSALDYGLLTIAVPGSGLNDSVLYPATHLNLAREILESGGALVSPFPDDTPGAPWTFPVRNGIMAGISQATLVIEADIKSGTLITSSRATDLSRDVLALPGSIFSPQSEGPNQLIRDGATPITCADDLREALGFGIQQKMKLAPTTRTNNLSPDEQRLISILQGTTLSRDALFNRFGGDISAFNALVSSLEIKGLLTELFGNLCLVSSALAQADGPSRAIRKQADMRGERNEAQVAKNFPFM
jgi:DNA processing protein